MKINTECEICNSTIKNAVRCIECNNLFCKSCIESWINTNESKNTKKSCPHCRTNNFDYELYPELDNLISSASISKCQKCLRIFFNKEEFEKHKIICYQVKCIVCHEIFKDNQSFINHFEKDGRYYEKYIICNYLNANPFNNKLGFICHNNNNKNKENNETPFGKIEKYKSPPDLIKNEIEINYFKNNFKKNSNNICINIFKKYNNYKGKLYKEYDLFYCNEDNNVNNKICSPGNELCPLCMTINQEYHKLKKHYLINSAGRVCTYNRNKVHCLCNFQRVFKKGDRIFCPDLICYKDEICLPCSEMKKLIKFYLNDNLINKLKKRDEQYGY